MQAETKVGYLLPQAYHDIHAGVLLAGQMLQHEQLVVADTAPGEAQRKTALRSPFQERRRLKQGLRQQRVKSSSNRS